MEKDSNNYGYYVTPFKYCVDLARNDMLDINSCDGPYDTLEEATEQGIDYDTNQCLISVENLVYFF